MKLEEIKKEAKDDLEIDDTLLDVESLKSIKLLGKWSEILQIEQAQLMKYDRDLKEEVGFKIKYYRGKCTKDELKERNLNQFLDRLNNSDLNKYLESDADISKLKIKHEYQEKKIELIRNYIDAIRQRTWAIKNAIEYRKYIGGH